MSACLKKNLKLLFSGSLLISNANTANLSREYLKDKREMVAVGCLAEIDLVFTNTFQTG